MMMVEASEVAAWMFESLEKEKILYQHVAVDGIIQEFGNEFAYINDNGNYSIDQKVLKEFRKLCAGTVTWEGSEKFWRFKMEHEA